MSNRAISSMLESSRAFAIAPAGCGKTQLISQIVADKRSGRQLVLTHTHAGLAAIRRRLGELGVPRDKCCVDTIAGWCLRYGMAYRGISGLTDSPEAVPNWPKTYRGAARVFRAELGRRVVTASYDGMLLDEYQDCSRKQHAIVRIISEYIPCRAVGDPLQTVFGFREDPCIDWSSVRNEFDVVEDALAEPWRWRRAGYNSVLGDWLLEARQELEQTGRLVVAPDAPITWIQHANGRAAVEAQTSVCHELESTSETVVAILKWPRGCLELARLLGGRWAMAEKFDDPDLFRVASTLAEGDGPVIVEALVRFLSDRVSGLEADLLEAAEAIKEGRALSRSQSSDAQVAKLHSLAETPTPAHALAWLDQVLANPAWRLYRPGCVYQLQEALRECAQGNLDGFVEVVHRARTTARHRGRLPTVRTIGTPLLVKGLEFDHAILFWEPDHLSVEGLYVALTRASKSLTIVSRTRTLLPAER